MLSANFRKNGADYVSVICYCNYHFQITTSRPWKTLVSRGENGPITVPALHMNRATMTLDDLFADISAQTR